MTIVPTGLTDTLIHEDIRNVLAGFAAAIELDQIRVDCLPPAKFHPPYDEYIWRNWRGVREATYIDAVNANPKPFK
jgi:hypothetical protein